MPTSDRGAVSGYMAVLTMSLWPWSLRRRMTKVPSSFCSSPSLSTVKIRVLLPWRLAFRQFLAPAHIRDSPSPPSHSAKLVSSLSFFAGPLLGVDSHAFEPVLQKPARGRFPKAGVFFPRLRVVPDPKEEGWLSTSGL